MRGPRRNLIRLAVAIGLCGALVGCNSKPTPTPAAAPMRGAERYSRRHRRARPQAWSSVGRTQRCMVITILWLWG